MFRGFKDAADILDYIASNDGTIFDEKLIGLWKEDTAVRYEVLTRNLSKRAGGKSQKSLVRIFGSTAEIRNFYLQKRYSPSRLKLKIELV
jgi:hypothetical protein